MLDSALMRATAPLVSMLGVSIAFACGDSSPGRFDASNESDAGDEASASQLPPASSTTDLCAAAAANGRLAGCHFMQIVAGTSTPEPPVNVYEPVWGCFALVITNPNDIPVHFRLRHADDESDGAPYARLVSVDGRSAQYVPLPGGALPPHTTAIVSSLHVPTDRPDIQLPPNFSLDCPGPAFIEAPSGAEGNVIMDRRGQAIELLSDAPIFALNVHAFQKDGGSDALPASGPWLPLWPPHNLYPVHLWRSTTLDVGAFRAGRPAKLENPEIPLGKDDHFSYTLSPGRTSVVAAEDGTTVVWPMLDGGAATVTLDRGGIETRRNEDGLIGRVFSSNKPIGIIHTLPTLIQWEFPFGDELDGAGLAAVVPPEVLWGDDYVAVRHADRWNDVKEQPPWRIIGAVDGTKLTYDPERPAGAPVQLNRGELAIFEADAPFAVSSQDAVHPFFLSGHMTGGRYALQMNGRYPNDGSRGGGVATSELPVSRWAKRYALYALMNWPEQYLLVVRRRGAKDVVLDCAGVVGGWRPAGGRFEYAYVSLIDSALEPVSFGASRCHAGPHWIASEDPFRATIWGVTTANRVRDDSIESSQAYAIPLLGDDRPATSSTQ